MFKDSEKMNSVAYKRAPKMEDEKEMLKLTTGKKSRLNKNANIRPWQRENINELFQKLQHEFKEC